MKKYTETGSQKRKTPMKVWLPQENYKTTETTKLTTDRQMDRQIDRHTKHEQVQTTLYHKTV